MNFKNFPYWLKGGIIGTSICLLLFFFYFFAGGMFSKENLFIPLLTGHLFLPFVVYMFVTSSQIIQIIAGIVFIIFLSALYFCIGACIGLIINKKHHK